MTCLRHLLHMGYLKLLKMGRDSLDKNYTVELPFLAGSNTTKRLSNITSTPALWPSKAARLCSTRCCLVHRQDHIVVSFNHSWTIPKHIASITYRCDSRRASLVSRTQRIVICYILLEVKIRKGYSEVSLLCCFRNRCFCASPRGGSPCPTCSS